ncbi:hypothetical protein MRX96_044711 [Rhipicephalus microplus]
MGLDNTKEKQSRSVVRDDNEIFRVGTNGTQNGIALTRLLFALSRVSTIYATGGSRDRDALRTANDPFQQQCDVERTAPRSRPASSALDPPPQLEPMALLRVATEPPVIHNEGIGGCPVSRAWKGNCVTRLYLVPRSEPENRRSAR